MTQRISNVVLLVTDYDQAIGFFVEKLQFTLLCDVPVAEGQRWVRVAPSSESDKASAIVLCLATPEQSELVGKQAGEGVFLFLQSDDFWQDYLRMQDTGVKFLETPREEVYATVVVFEDLYGNKWDLLQPKF